MHNTHSHITCEHTQVHTDTHTQIHTHTRAHIHTHTHIHTQIVQEEDESCVIDGQDRSKPYVVVFDPLDGSSNIAASIPTGTIVGVGGLECVCMSALHVCCKLQ